MLRLWTIVSCGAVLALGGCQNCINIVVPNPDASTTPVEPLWTMDQPFPEIAHLNGVWGYTHDDVWAVGAKGAIVHYDGTAWTKVPAPTDADLYDIDGSEDMQDGDKDIYAVGASGTIIHWDGTVWMLESNSPPVYPPILDPRDLSGGTVHSTLMGVWHGRRDGIYVVGERGTILVKRWIAGDPITAPGTWSYMTDELVQDRIPVCETRFAYDTSTGFPAVGSGGLCAPASGVSYCNGPDFNPPVDCELPYIQRTGYDPEDNPTPPNAQCSYGQRCTENNQPAYTTTFFPIDLKKVVGYGSGADLRVIAVGESGTVMELRPTGLTSSGNLATWNCEGTNANAPPDFCWRPVARVGSEDAGNPAVRDSLAGVWGRWGSDIYAVGEDGRLLWRDGDDAWVRGTDVTQAQWLRDFLSPPTPVFLRDLWHQGRGDFFIVGFSGVVLRHGSDGWVREEVPTSAHLRSVWGKTRDDLDASLRDAEAPRLRTVIAVGSEGVILRRSISQ
ncbi:MAG: hypothetical protein JXR83_21710 [Deltaproteobacteria bacterium]|nr:hypothetical protein [Deltaproteobacteria bacterium]